MNAAIQSWRQELESQAGLTAEIRRELEAHLLDCMAGFARQGLSETESFQLACQRMGQPKQINAEFNKVMNTSSHWNRPLTVAAWSTYVISFFLPAYNNLCGWKCATIQSFFWHGDNLQAIMLDINYQLLLLANLLMLASPVLFTRLSKNMHQVQWLHHLTLAAVILVWGFVLQIFIGHIASGLKIGCLLWSLSFILLYLSVVFERQTMRKELHPA